MQWNMEIYLAASVCREKVQSDQSPPESRLKRIERRMPNEEGI